MANKSWWRVPPALMLLLLCACAAPGAGAGAGGSTGGVAGTSTDVPSGSVGDPTDPLAGRTFLSTAITGHQLVADSRIRITFRDAGELTARADCNHLLGRYRWTDGTLIVDRMGSTEMGCPRPLMEQDVWLTDLLTGELSATLDGPVLTLTRDGVTLELTDREVADPDRPLQGTTWRLDGIITGDTVSTVPQGITATLTIADGHIHFFDGTNDSDGVAAVDPAGGVVEVTDIATSAVGCADGYSCSVDMSMLTSRFHFAIEGPRLTVTDDAGAGLTFTAIDQASKGTESGSPRTVSATTAAMTTTHPAGAGYSSGVPAASSSVNGGPAATG